MAEKGEDPFHYYRQGDHAKARALLKRELANAEASKSKEAIWNALIRNAFFYQEVDQLRQAVEFFNRSLSLSKKFKDRAREGKTFAAIGWTYARMGYYEIAQRFYRKAIEIGAVEGQILHPGVWGQATQELGALYMAMGDLETAENLLQQTFDFAKKNEILPGISEGGAHLAQLNLLRANLGRAENFAEEAMKAAQSCACSEYVSTWTKVIYARVQLEIADLATRRKEFHRRRARDTIEEAAKSAEKFRNKRFVAESKMLQSRLLPQEKIAEKIKLLTEAREILYRMNSEIRGESELELGRSYLEKNDQKLARFYLQHGIDLSRQLFRKLDLAFVLAETAKLEGLKDKSKIKNLEKAEKLQAEAKAYVALFETQQRLFEIFESNRLHTMAHAWINRALDTLRIIMEAEEDADHQRSRQLEFLRLQERQMELELKIRFSSESQAIDAL